MCLRSSISKVPIIVNINVQNTMGRELYPLLSERLPTLGLLFRSFYGNQDFYWADYITIIHASTTKHANIPQIRSMTYGKYYMTFIIWPIAYGEWIIQYFYMIASYHTIHMIWWSKDMRHMICLILNGL